jgi:DNA-binding transcriptional ArsR family regulator
MAEIKDILNDSTRLTILAQIARHGGEISAKDIAQNIDIPLTTVYHHLNALEREEYISAKEVRVRNLNKKVWERTTIPIEDPEKLRVTNIHYDHCFSKEPNMISTYVTFFNALIKEDLVNLKNLSDKDFEDHQKNSTTPLYVKMHLLDSEDYRYAMEKLMEIRDTLWERAEKKGRKIIDYKRTNIDDSLKYFLFTLALPDLENL